DRLKRELITKYRGDSEFISKQDDFAVLNYIETYGSEEPSLSVMEAIEKALKHEDYKDIFISRSESDFLDESGFEEDELDLDYIHPKPLDIEQPILREIPVELPSRTVVRTILQEVSSSPITDPDHESGEDTMGPDQENVKPNDFQETLEGLLDTTEDPDNIVHDPELTTHFNNVVTSMEMFVEYRRLISY
ncbi:hypothetical protein BCR41DRAFT_407827, partial [Lobosporangium transversale]